MAKYIVVEQGKKGFKANVVDELPNETTGMQTVGFAEGNKLVITFENDEQLSAYLGAMTGMIVREDVNFGIGVAKAAWKKAKRSLRKLLEDEKEEEKK